MKKQKNIKNSIKTTKPKQNKHKKMKQKNNFIDGKTNKKMLNGNCSFYTTLQNPKNREKEGSLSTINPSIYIPGSIQASPPEFTLTLFQE